ncbi:MAG: hypothetical protein ACXWDO_07590, partial [Bacteroidia bacterium]
MSRINLEERFGEAINSVWEEFSSKTATEEYCKISPACIDFANPNSVLFIGLNPSLRKTDIADAQKWDTSKK